MKNKVLNLLRTLYQWVFQDKEYFKKGITVLICAKDEEHNIELCINSVLEFATQIICIDHDSNDATYDIMLRCHKKNKLKCDFIVMQEKSPFLINARNKGLKYVNCEWVLHIGGDFVFYEKSSPFYLEKLLKSILNKKKYSAVRLGFVNLYGDLFHTYKDQNVYQLGEFYFFKNHKSIVFKEHGKFDYLSFPWFFYRLSVDKPAFFHLSGLKSDERLLYRNCYFEWKELLNSNNSNNFNDFYLFKNLWREQLFESRDLNSIKYRFQKQMVEFEIIEYDVLKYYPYPYLIQDLLNAEINRFKIINNEEEKYRIDSNDEDMLSYKETKEDKSWNVQHYSDKYKKKYYLHTIKEIMEKND